MSGNQLTVFTSNECVNCPPYKKFLEVYKIPVAQYVNLSESEENRALASQYRIQGLPAAVVHSPEGDVLYIGTGTGSIDRVKQLMLP